MSDEVQQADITEEEQRKLIETKCKNQMLTIERWDTEDDRLRAWIKGEWEVIEEDEDRGLYQGSTGQLYAVVVGGLAYRNVHVKFYLQEEGMDGATANVTPGLEVERV